MKTEQYNDIIIQLNKKSENNYHLAYAVKVISAHDIDNLISLISNREMLVNYVTETPLRGRTMCVLLCNVMPLIFDDAEIEKYFLDVLITMHNDEEKWEYHKKIDLFKIITGYSYRRTGRKLFYLSQLFENVYETFLSNYLYPLDFVNRGLDMIEKEQPLAEHYKEYMERYFRSDHNTYNMFMETYLIPRVGKDNFLQYLKVLAAQFDKTLVIRYANTYTNDRFLNYMFGYHWDIGMHMFSSRKRDLEIHEIETLVLRAIIPYTIVNYVSQRQRRSVYSALNLSDDEISELEQKLKSANRQLRLPKMIATTIDNSEALRFGNTYKDIFALIDRAIDDLSRNRQMFFKSNIFEKCKNLSSGALYSDLLHAKKTPSIWANVVTYMEEKSEKTYDRFFQTNQEEFDKEVWVIFYKNNYHYRSVTFSFDTVNNKEIRSVLKDYCKQKIISSNYELATMNSLKHCITALSYIIDTFHVHSIESITEYQILSHLRYLESEKGLTPGALSGHLSPIKGFFRDYSSRTGCYDPSLNIALRNISEHRQNTPVIPEDLLVYVDDHVDDIKQTDCSLAYQLLLETGWRFGDIQKITPNHLSVSDDGSYGIVSTLSPKTRKSRTKRSLGAEITDVITLSLYEKLVAYIDDTAPIRETYGITTLFFSIVNGRVAKFSANALNRAINNMLSAAGITSINDMYIRFTTKQTRKTVASTLISGGAPISSVQKKLGHVSAQTAERYYAEVNKMKLADLNDEFYQKKFNVYLDPEKLKLFTEEERRLLYVDFCLNRRTVELGVCSKHPSEGRCASLGHTSCATCPKLCTGKKWLSRWQKLADDSWNLLQMFRDKYKDMGISESEYSTFIEYKQELNSYNKYLAVIEQIKKEGNQYGGNNIS